MAAAAQIVEGMGADIVDVNMGCPVPKIAKHHAGCSLMRTPEHAADVIGAMTRAVSIPVTVKMRSGWDGEHVNAPDLAKRVEQAGAAAVAVHGRTAAQSYTGRSDWSLIDDVARRVSIPVFGSGDCITPDDLVERMRETAVAGVLVGRGALRNPWIFDQAQAAWRGGDPPPASPRERGRFLLAYIDLLLREATEVEPGWLPAHGRPRPPGRSETPERRQPRAVDRQQAAGPRIVVHEGDRPRVAPADRDQHRPFARRAARGHPRLLSTRRSVASRHGHRRRPAARDRARGALAARGGTPRCTESGEAPA